MKQFELLELVIGGCDQEDCHCEEHCEESEEEMQRRLRAAAEAAAVEVVELVEVV